MPHEAQAWHFPESLDGRFCLIRVGVIVHRWRAWPWAWKLGRSIAAVADQATGRPAGLLSSERFLIAWNHFGVLQYWRNEEDLFAWAHAAPHTDWWRNALERQRVRHDFSIYHETIVATPGGIEAIYSNLEGHRPGASGFGELKPPKGAFATARGRLGGITPVEVSGAPAKVDRNRTGP